MRGKKRLFRKWATIIVNEELPEEYMTEGEATCWITDGDVVSYDGVSYYVNNDPVSRTMARDTILHILYGKRAKRSYFNAPYKSENLYW
ncbi:hypothetical protein ACFVS2_26845 [Brevibacillus sp. NPDC058079]|uniref:hypothetical protein n=1 Tax=Brevibacillus sp. NPDC058079 TaxID=3346330 RepID=UPI0036E4BA36